MITLTRLLALALAAAAGLGGLLALGACEGVPLTAAPGTAITLVANPTFVASNGGRSVVSAILVEPAGTFVPDGTEVFFFTNLGRVDPDSAKTVDGVARIHFVADSRSGIATVSAVSGGPAPAPAPTASPTNGTGNGGVGVTANGTGSASVDIAIGGALPARLVVAASPARITFPRRATIVATVYDQYGNPVQNVPVNFTITSASLPGVEETLESGGSPRFTDSNGQAFDTLVTRAGLGAAQKTVVVTATAPPNLSTAVTVFID